MDKMQLCFCDSIRSMVVNVWNVVLSGIYVKQHDSTHALNW
jgi:hypothetical protein